MAANPLTYQELEAFERKACVRFTAWETDLLMRIDDAILAAAANRAAPATQTPGPTVVDLSNGKGVRDFMSVLAIRQNARLAQSRKKEGRHG